MIIFAALLCLFVILCLRFGVKSILDLIVATVIIGAALFMTGLFFVTLWYAL